MEYNEFFLLENKILMKRLIIFIQILRNSTVTLEQRKKGYIEFKSFYALLTKNFSRNRQDVKTRVLINSRIVVKRTETIILLSAFIRNNKMTRIEHILTCSKCIFVRNV